MLNAVWIVLLACTASLAATQLVRFYALGRGLLDQPGGRSSHTKTTPRGGGLAIAVVALLGGMLIAPSTAVLWALGASLVTLVGLIDDHGHLAARWRLGVHAMASVLLVSTASVPPLTIGAWTLAGPLAMLVWALAIVWLINLFNFMDGINGIATCQTIFVCGALLVLGGITEQPLPTWLLLPLLGAALGFLPWNFPRARIFMGDGGSGFIGFSLAAVCLYVADEKMAWAVLILMGTFIVDATLTLLRRLFVGERVYDAHRTHAYQYAARRHGAHWVVTLAYAAINILWVLPWAWAAASGRVPGLWALLGSYALLAVGALYYRAGVPERRGLT